LAWVATAIIGSAVVGGAATAYAANTASSAQQQAAATAANTQLQMYNQTQQTLSPYVNAGNSATNQLTSMLPSLTAPIALPDVNPQDFVNSDQYKFLQSQGERAVTNSSAARGLATSGAALKGAATFESGLNSTQWQQDFNNQETNFNNQVTNQTNAYNRLKGLIDTGESAAAQTGTAATATGQGVAASETAAGNAAAAGANAIGTATTNVANAVPNAFITSGLYGKLTSGTSAGPTSVGGLPLA
jgi:hypothetical protein